MNKNKQKYKSLIREIKREMIENSGNKALFNQKKITLLNHSFDAKKEWIIPKNKNRPILELMDKEISNLLDAITNSIELPDVKSKIKYRDDLETELVGYEYKTRIPSGMILIINDLEGHLSPIERQHFQEELKAISICIENLNNQKTTSLEKMMEKLATTPDTFQGLFGLSDKTIEHFYQSGSRYYNASYFKEAADVFYLLSFLNPQKYSIWLSLGLSEKSQNQFEKALQAFSMAIIMDPKLVLPHLLSAKCYLELKEYHLANETLKYAQNMLKENSSDESRKYESYISHLLEY